MNTIKCLALGFVTIAPVSVASAQSVVSFEMIPDVSTARDLTPDGRYIVGVQTSGNGYILDTWTGTLTDLGPDGTDVDCVSDDGTVVGGGMDHPDGVSQTIAARWTAGTGWEDIGELPHTGTSCGSSSSTYEMSADGSVIVGLSWVDVCDARGFRWTAEDGMEEMEGMANGSCRASVVSADGALLAGFCQGSFSRTPAIWTADGVGQLLDPPNGDVNGEVNGISDDGTKLTGVWDGKPFIFDETTGLEIFDGVIPAWAGSAYDIADDDTVVGFDFFMTARRAWLRPDGGPARDLRMHLVDDLGVDPVATNMPGSLDVAIRVSADGRIIIGSTFFVGAWRINLCVPDLDGSGAIDIGDLLAVLAAWGTGGTPADFDGNGTVDISDLLFLLSAWGACPSAPA